MADRELTTDPPTDVRTKRKRPRLRRVGVVVGFLLAGAIINVLVAWGIAYSLADTLFDDVKAASNGWVEATEREYHWLSQFDFGIIWFQVPPPWLRGEIEGTGFQRICYARESDSMFGPLVASPIYAGHTKTGMPLVTLQSTDLYAGGDNRNFESAIVFVEDTSAAGTSATHSLPLKPVWPGLLINTVFWGVIVWMMFAAPLAVRCHRRAKRSRCPDCGYDLRGADHGKCPECGEAVVGKRRQPNSRTAKQVEE